MTALATASYATFRPSMGVAVQTSVGRPKRIDYEAREQVRELMPYGLLKLRGDEFRRAYRARLDKLDLDALRAKFDAISKRNGHKRLVLLCFEDVHAGQHCHRRDFADFWLERTGQRIPELGSGGTVILEGDPDYDRVVRPPGAMEPER